MKFIWFILLSLYVPLLLEAQPKLRFETQDSLFIGDEAIISIYLEDVDIEHKYSSMTLRCYYDADEIEMVSLSSSGSIFEQRGNLMVTQNYPAKLPEGNFKKFTYLFYQAERIQEEGLIGEIRVKFKRSGEVPIYLNMAKFGSWDISKDNIIGNTFKVGPY